MILQLLAMFILSGVLTASALMVGTHIYEWWVR